MFPDTTWDTLLSTLSMTGDGPGDGFWDGDLVEYKMTDGNTAFEYALHHERIDILRVLLEADNSFVSSGTAPVPLLFAALKNNIQLLELLLQYGADVIAKTDVAGQLSSGQRPTTQTP